MPLFGLAAALVAGAAFAQTSPSAAPVVPFPPGIDRRYELAVDPGYEERARAYCLANYGIDSFLMAAPRAIIVHATHTASLAETIRSFSGPIEKTRPELSRGGALETGSHFIVDTDGTVYSRVPLPFVARHAVGYNHLAVGIEIQAATNTAIKEGQLESAAALILALERVYPGIEYVFGHDEYDDASKPWHRLMTARDKTYRPWPKTDPGETAMKRIRELLVRGEG